MPMINLLHLLIDTAEAQERRPRVWRVHPNVFRQLRVEVEAMHWSFVYNPQNPLLLLGLPTVVDKTTMGILLESDP